MAVLIVLASILLLVLLISWAKLNPFLSFLLVSLVAGLSLGIDPATITLSIQKGLGEMLGGLVVVIVAGSMLGKLVAESGAAQRISSALIQLFGQRNLPWAFMITGFVIGIPLFYNVGFVLVVPLIFSVVHRFKIPMVTIAIPILASLSVTHGFLPPHPSPAALVRQFGAHMGSTLLLGLVIAIPAVILAGPVFAKRLQRVAAPLPKTFVPKEIDHSQLPGLANSMVSALLPVILLTVTSLMSIWTFDGPAGRIVAFVSAPDIVMIVSLLVATLTLGTGTGMKVFAIMNHYGDAVKDIAMVLLIMAGAGALKEVLVESGVTNEIAGIFSSSSVHPLVIGWGIAATIRVCLGSATVAGLAAAGIVAPVIGEMNVHPSLMVLSIGAGSLMFSHVNDTGFWLFKEYFNLSIRDTIMSWSLMETIVAVMGLVGALVLDVLLQTVSAT